MEREIRLKVFKGIIIMDIIEIIYILIFFITYSSFETYQNENITTIFEI
jgi:hypothetical protein